MEVFNFCLEIIEQEAEKFNVDLKKFNSANQITAATANDVNYDITHNRCAYLYRCGTINISFAKDCFSRFIIECSNLGHIFSKWDNYPNLTISTLSKGPAFDYVAFLLAFSEYLPQTSLSLFKTINMISKYGAWRNTVAIMQQKIEEGYLRPLSGISFENCKVIQGDPFDSFPDKIKTPISQSDVLMMIKSIKLTDSSNEQKVSSAVKDLLEALKPEAILFCIDTKPVTTIIESVLSKFHGKYLLAPVFVNTILDFDCPDTFKISFGCPPVISARGIFFVWQKLSNMPMTPIDYQIPTLQPYQASCNSIQNHNAKVNDSKLSLTPCDETNLANSKACHSASSNFPKHYVQPNVNSTITGDSKNIGHISTKNFSIDKQIHPSLMPRKNYVDSNEHASIEHNDTVKESNNSHIYFNKFVQTEQKDRVETDSSKIVALTNRVTKLTTTIKELLQMNELQSAFKEEIPSSLEKYNETSLPSCSANNCSSSCSFIQHNKHSCHSHCICFRKECTNHYGNCGCQQVCLNCNSNYCTVSHNNGYQIRNCNSSCCDSNHCTVSQNKRYQIPNCNSSCCDSKFSKTDANQYSNCNTPNIVIPLGTLSKELESLIISSLSKSD